MAKLLDKIVNIPYIPTARQALLHTSQAFETFYGGQAGGGKSEALLWEGYQICIEIPNAIVPIFRRTYPELEESLIRRSLQKFPPGYGKYNVSRKEWRFPNGSVLEFRHCEKESDVYDYQSAEWQHLLIDELTHFTEFQYEYLKSRVRGGDPRRRGVKSGSNPGNVGHAWVKRRFIDHKLPNVVYDTPVDIALAMRLGIDLQLIKPSSSVFIPARLRDNPYMMDNDPQYAVRLMSLPDKERRALLEGDWDIFEGQVFGTFRSNLHVVEPIQVQRSTYKGLCVDYGFTEPYACLWFQREPTGHVVIYRELYERLVPAHQQAKNIVAATNEELMRLKGGDPSMWSHNQDKSIAEIYAENGLVLQPANNARLAGKMRVHEYLEPDDEGRPWVQFTSNCYNLIRTLPELIYDAHNVEDVNTHGEDHAYDVLRYILMGLPSIRRNTTEPKEVHYY